MNNIVMIKKEVFEDLKSIDTKLENDFRNLMKQFHAAGFDVIISVKKVQLDDIRTAKGYETMIFKGSLKLASIVGKNLKKIIEELEKFYVSFNSDYEFIES